MSRHQHAAEVVAGCRNHLQPTPPEQEIVNVVGDDEFFDRHSLFPEALLQIDSLVKIDIAIIVRVDEKDR